MAHESSLSNVSPINEIWQDKTKKPYPIRSVRCTDDCSIEWILITHSRANRSDLISRNAATTSIQHLLMLYVQGTTKSIFVDYISNHLCSWTDMYGSNLPPNSRMDPLSIPIWLKLLPCLNRHWTLPTQGVPAFSFTIWWITCGSPQGAKLMVHPIYQMISLTILGKKWPVTGGTRQPLTASKQMQELIYGEQ